MGGAGVRREQGFLGVALLALAVAAWTGVLLRFGLIGGMPPWAANYTAVRHAHSHLMYFGWGTLGLMALIWARLPQSTHRPLPRGVSLQMGLTALLSLLSFPAFWANGYGPTTIAGRALPLGSMAAALNGLPWFLFAALYVRATWRLPQRPLPLQLWDWALALLLLASAGAMGLGMLVALDVESAFLHNAALHLFLDLFAVGWFTLATLGLIWATLGAEQAPDGWMPTQALALCLGITFFLGMSPALLPALPFWVAALANAAAALLLAKHLSALVQRRAQLPPLVRFGLLLLGLHLLTAAAVLIPGLWREAATPLRIYVLHTLLLGWMSSALLGLTLAEIGRLPARAVQGIGAIWMAGVAGMLAALGMLGLAAWLPLGSTLLWLRLAAWSSLLPATAALLTLPGALAAGMRRPAPAAAAPSTPSLPTA